MRFELPYEVVEYGVQLDDIGSIDTYDSRLDAEAGQRRHGGTLVRLTTRIEQVAP